MLRQVARKTQQFLGQRQQFMRHGRIGVESIFLHAFSIDLAAIPPLMQLGEAVERIEIHTQRLAHILQGRTRMIDHHRRRQRGAMAPILVVDILHDFLAPLVLEIHVDIGRLVALFRDEALEQQRGHRRIDLGDAQAIAHTGVGRRAAPLAQDALAAREVHHIVDGQEVRLVRQLFDQPQFLFHLLLHRCRNAARVARIGAFVSNATQIMGKRFARRHDLFRILVAQFLHRKVAPLGQRHTLTQGLGLV